MTAECVMCGAPIQHGILCPMCDRPRRVKLPAARPAPSGSSDAPAAAAIAVEAFPKSPVVPFPMESVTPAITSVANVLVAAAVPAVVLAPDRSVKFMTEGLRKLFGLTHSDPSVVRRIEELTGVAIGSLSVGESKALRLRDRRIQYSLVPLSGGAGGAVLIFRPADATVETHASFASFVRETVLQPLRSVRDSLRSARAEQGQSMLRDGAAALDQILSSLEMAPGVEELPPSGHVPKVTEVVQEVVNRFIPFAEMSAVRLQASVPDLDDRLRDHHQLADVLGVLMENSLHYVPSGGQVVAGVRAMEHKGRPILLFFVMDNGPLVPEHLRHLIFERGFVWNSSVQERSGGGLSKVREFAAAHGGSVWVDSKTGRTCTFFVRVSPDRPR